MSELIKTKRKVGAPSKKTQTICDAICEGIATGKSSRAMCIELEISQPTLWKWLNEDEEFSKQYARAKELGHDYMAEEIIDIADDSGHDIQKRDDGSTYVDNEAVQRSRLRVDARKWYLSKLAPKKYGDKATVELQGGDPEKPITQSIKIAFIPSNIEKQVDCTNIVQLQGPTSDLNPSGNT